MKRLLQTVLFFILYGYAILRNKLSTTEKPWGGTHGSFVAVYKGEHNGKPSYHGVVVFVLPPGISTDDYSSDLWGPFGYTSEIDILGYHLYGRDTWGTITQEQLEKQPMLKYRIPEIGNSTVVLAGVRRLNGSHLKSMSNAAEYVLVRK